MIQGQREIVGLIFLFNDNEYLPLSFNIIKIVIKTLTKIIMSGMENTGGGRTFINTFKGSFTKRANEQTTGAKSRVNKNNDTVWELQFNTLKDYYLQQIEKYKSEDYGFQWNLYLAHAHSDEVLKLTLPYSGRITMGFFLRLPKLDVTLPMTFKLYYFEADNKSALVMHQNDVKIEVQWSKDNPGDLPPLEEKVINGETKWDSSKRMDYLEGYLKSQIEPNLLGIDAPVPQTIDPSVTIDTSDEDGAWDSKKNKESLKEYLEDDQPLKSQDKKEKVQNTLKEKTVVEWDGEAGTLKRKHTDGVYYACDEKGVFKLDDKQKMISALPF